MRLNYISCTEAIASAVIASQHGIRVGTSVTYSMEYHVILLFNSNLIHGYLDKIGERGNWNPEDRRGNGIL